MMPGSYSARDIVATLELPDGRVVSPVVFDTDVFLRARITTAHIVRAGGAFNACASWWRLDQHVVPRAGATWYVMTKWPRSGDDGPAVVDDFGNLVCVGWRQ